jgi:hypothetical protein
MSPRLFILAGFALAGCAQPGAAPGRLGAGQVAGLGVATAAGAVVGDKLGGTTGALVGGAAGLAGSAWLANELAAASGPGAAEAAEAARRDERQKIMRQYWYEQTEALQADAPPGTGAGLPLHYPAGAYDGINFGARTAPDSSLGEPVR